MLSSLLLVRGGAVHNILEVPHSCKRCQSLWGVGWGGKKKQQKRTYIHLQTMDKNCEGKFEKKSVRFIRTLALVSSSYSKYKNEPKMFFSLIYFKLFLCVHIDHLLSLSLPFVIIKNFFLIKFPCFSVL